ncbi:Spermine oxidase [Mizuhopecten yessoensis]|uniref:Spermine oxidase n=2 Tax=Mizuhopecten yessoensis TaxID=6573 RepID=A0A210PIC8_MIZYE|nr:Spermine oxidase [Mizuhopecten yessoensis]
MYVGSNGTKCNEELVRKAREEFRKIIEELYGNKLSASSKTLYPTILEYIQYRLDQVVETLPDNDRNEFKDICRTLTKVEEENHGAALEDVSVFIPDSITPGNNISLTGGYSALISRLAHTVTDKRIHLKTEVINIDYTNPEEVNVLCESENGAIMYTADHVIVTISLGVLKNDHQILFNPGLPFEKIASISKLGYGTASKIILRYKTPFWSQHEGMKLVWRNDTTESNTNLPSWAKCLYTFNAMAANPYTLDVWLCGEEGKEIETIPNDVIALVLTTVLRQFLNDPTIPEPDSILKTSWFSNRQFRGSYSYIRVGSTVEDVRILAMPLVAKDNKPVLLFAGEATDIDYLASTHGSLNSGIREANRLLMRQMNTFISHVKPC